MEIIIYVVIASLIIRFLIRYSRAVSECRKCINNLGVPDEPNPPYDSSQDDFTCFHCNDGSTTLALRDGTVFNANPRPKRDT